VDALTISGVALSLGAGAGLLRTRGKPVLTAWHAVLFFTAIRALLTPERDLAFFRLLLLAVAWLAYALVYRWPERARAAMPYAATAALALALVALIVGGLPVSWLWDRNVTADTLLLLLPWLRGPVWWTLGLLLLALTGSRGAWFGAVAAFLWLGVRPRWYVWLLIVGALAVGLVFIRPETAQVRMDIWIDAARMIIARPLTGWGIGATVAGGHIHAHNILLDALVNGGVFLGAAWALFLYAIVRMIEGPSGSRARLGLAAFMLHGLVDCEIWTPVVLLAAVNLALLVRYRESENSFGECTHSGDLAPGAPATA
jgi:O-antigen ligase